MESLFTGPQQHRYAAGRTAARSGAWALLVVLAACTPADPQLHRSEHQRFYAREVISEGINRPWAIAFVSPTEWLVTERPGHLRVVRDGVLDPKPVVGAPKPLALMQGGMLDVALHPEFQTNRLVYLTWTRRCTDNCGTTVAVGRGRWTGTELADFEELYAADACDDDFRHYGGRIVLTDDGDLFMSVGERNNSPRAQRLGDDAGSILRLRWDGTLPPDNPFIDEPGASPAVWSHGHRNPQGLVLHPITGVLWQHEHGPQGGDELNRIEPKRNYGWPVITHGREYSGQPIGVGTHQDGMEQPIAEWTPSIAPSGMVFYTGDAFPGWQGDLFIGSLSRTQLIRLRLDGDRVLEEEALIDTLGHRIRDVRQGPDGLLYLLVDDPMGKILRLEPAD